MARNLYRSLDMKHGDAVEFKTGDGWVMAKYNATATREQAPPGYVFVIWHGCDQLFHRSLVRKA